jgi:hypothetical protein
LEKEMPQDIGMAELAAQVQELAIQLAKVPRSAQKSGDSDSHRAQAGREQHRQQRRDPFRDQRFGPKG